MSSLERLFYISVGLLIFIACGWLTVVAVSAVSQDINHSVFSIPTTAWIGTLGSISASGIFFVVSEALRWAFDHSVTRSYGRLKFYEDTVGILDFFNQKGSDAAKMDYGDAISSARHRVWAFGISNGEFISEHLDGLIAKKKRSPELDVCICFIDPDTTLHLPGTDEPCRISLVQLFDITRDEGLIADNSSRVSNRINHVKNVTAAAGVQIDIRLITAAGYVSAMVLDDIIYVFPFTAVSKDNTCTPYLKVSTSSSIGMAFFSFLAHLTKHPKLSRISR